MLRLHEDQNIRSIIEQSDVRVHASQLAGNDWSAVAAEVSATVVSSSGDAIGRAFEGTILYFPGVTLKMLTHKEGA
jgi:hypothetical protein